MNLIVLLTNDFFSGFWNAYLTIREFIHLTLRRELLERPAHVYFTGHSLGGALASLAALDVSINTIPRVNAYFRHKRYAIDTYTTHFSAADVVISQNGSSCEST
jgi:putative lipase involved disintegration of autophagic bodies